MTKAILIQGCKDCPYKMKVKTGWRCTHGCFDIFRTSHSNAYISHQSLPDTPHPDCKLNDLPDIADINYFASSVSPVVKKARVEGAQFIIEQISK